MNTNNTPAFINKDRIYVQEAQRKTYAQDRSHSFYSNLSHVRLSSGGNTSRSSHYSRHASDSEHFAGQGIILKNADLLDESKSYNNMKKEPFPVKETKSSMQRKRTSRKKIESNWRISNY